CFFFQAEDGIRDKLVTGVQTCALPISTADMTAAARLRSFRREAPAPVFATLGTQHPILMSMRSAPASQHIRAAQAMISGSAPKRSEEHTSELQSLAYLVCRLLLEKKKT